MPRRRSKVSKPKAPPKSTQAQRNKARESRLRQIFNITSEEYEKMLAHQNGVCAITNEPTSTLYIDHAHDNGLVRGLLSYKVNKGLAYFDDDPDLLENAAKYLRNPPSVGALGERVYGVIGRVTKRAKNRRYGPEGTKEPQPRSIFTKIKSKETKE